MVAAVLALRLGPVAGGRRPAVVIAAVDAGGRDRDARRGLRVQRSGRWRSRPAGGSHRQPPRGERPGEQEAGLGLVAGAVRGRPGGAVAAAAGSSDRRAVQPGPGGRLSVHEAYHLVAPGLAGTGIHLGRAGRLDRAAIRSPRGPGRALRRFDLLVHGLRYELRAAGPGGRCLGRYPVERAAPGAARARRGHRVLWAGADLVGTGLLAPARRPPGSGRADPRRSASWLAGPDPG